MANNKLHFRSTRGAATLLGVPPTKLYRAVWDERLDPPPKTPSGDFMWREHDIRRAAWVLLGRDLDDVLAERGTTPGRATA